MELFKNAGSIHFEETKDGYEPAGVTDKTLKPSLGVILKCEFDQNTGFFYVGFEGVEKSLGGKFSPEALRHMIDYMENKLQGAL